MKQVASLRYGVIFKKAFSDVDVFKGFVRDILGINLKIDKVETEKEYKPAIGQVAVKFDLYAQDDEGRVIVEIQHQNYADHYDRFLHYHCVALLEQVKTAKNYRSPLAVYTIVVLTSPDSRYREDVLTIDFDLRNKDGKKLNAIPHKIIYLCPKYLNENTPLPYREWLELISDSLDNQVDETHYHLPEISKVLNYIEADVSPEEKARMIDEYNFEEWRAEGIKESKLEIAKTMLQKGLSLEMIAEITGLNEEAISNVGMNN